MCSMPMYSYESKDKLYDLIVMNGEILVRTNCGPWSSSLADWSPIHLAIAQHYHVITGVDRYYNGWQNYSNGTASAI